MKLNRYLQILGITFALILGNNAPAFCQPRQNDPSQVRKVKDQLLKAGVAEDVTVILHTGKKYSGAISKIETDSFKIIEVTLKQTMVFDYKDVKKVRTKKHGGLSSLNGWPLAAVIVGVILLTAALASPRT
jgi:hypothetical protein